MTTIFTLTDEYQQIGEGSLTATMSEGRNAWISTGTAPPETDAGYTILKPGGGAYRYTGSLKTFARIAPNSSGVRTKLSVVEEEGDRTQEVPNGGSIYFPLSTIGNGFIQVGDDEERCDVSWKASGEPEIISSSENVTKGDAPGNLCLFAESGKLTVKNNLGSTKIITYRINYR